jgi:hypothetical protein
LIEYKEGPLPLITLPFPDETRILADNGLSYRVRRADIKRIAQLQTYELPLEAFRYFNVELLDGEIDIDEGRIHLLFVYKGDDERRIAVEFKPAGGLAETVVANLYFS